MQAWTEAGKATQSIVSITADELSERLANPNNTGRVLDVRKPGEYEAEHVENAHHFPLSQINDNLHQLDPAATYFVHCRSGYRSMIASSIMAAKGFSNIVEIKGGFMAIQKTSIPVTQFVCPNSK